MYVGTAEFQTANARSVQKHIVYGTVGEDSFDETNILAGSLSVTRQICDSSDFKLGGVFISTLKLTFLRNFRVTAETWRDKPIYIAVQLRVSDVPETYEGFQMGLFTVASAISVADGIEVIAYDYMAKFDKLLPDVYAPSGKPFTIVSQICARCGVAFGNTQAQIEALPNGNKTIALWSENDCRTYRDVLFWLAQTLGGFCYIDTTGHLRINSYKTIMDDPTPAPELPYDERCTGGQVSDYRTAWHGIYIRDMETGENNYVGPNSPGPVYDCGANPFMQYGTALTFLEMAHNVLDSVSVHLRPFNVSIMSMPIWFPGDPISLTGGIATNYEQKTIVHYVEWNPSTGTKLACFGSNPRLNGTKANATANAASKSSTANETIYARYENDTAVTVGSSPVKIVDILFSANKPADVEIWHEFQLETNPDPGEKLEIEATYYMDLVEIDRKPVETWDDAAKHLLDLHYMTRVPDAGSHEWSVYLTATNGTALIKKNGALAVLKGQGLAKQDAWDGVIVLDDTITSFSLVAGFITINDSVVVDVRALDHRLQLTDSPASLGSIVTFNGVTENCAVTLGYADFINFMGENYYMGTEGVLL